MNPSFSPIRLSLSARRAVAAAVCALALFAAAPARAAESSSLSAWEKELGDWRSHRFERLSSPDGWLTLVGLLWLHEGENRFGSSLANEAILAGAPPLIGTFSIKGQTIELASAPDVVVTHDGARVTRLVLATDATEKPTVLVQGTLSFFVIERGGRYALRVKDSASRQRREFKGIDYFPADPSYRVEAHLEPAPAGATVPVPNVLGTMEPTPTPGVLVFELGGQERRITAFGERGTDELFLVFGDRTNGKESYGGGRFLYAAKPDAAGKTVLDFNRAYNPPCAFTAFATCPLPPRDNKLDVEIRAGEKKYGAGHP